VQTVSSLPGCLRHGLQSLDVTCFENVPFIRIYGDTECQSAPVTEVVGNNGKCTVFPEQGASIVTLCDESYSILSTGPNRSSGSPGIWSQTGGSSLQAFYSEFPGAEHGIVNVSFASVNVPSSMVVDGNGNLCMAFLFVVTCVDGVTGDQVWSASLPPMMQDNNPGLGMCNNGLLYAVGSGGNDVMVATYVVGAYNLTNGSLVWSVSVRAPSNEQALNQLQPPIVDPELCHIVVNYQAVSAYATMSSISAVDGNTGEWLWHQTVSTIITQGADTVWGSMAMGLNGNLYTVAWRQGNNNVMLAKVYELYSRSGTILSSFALPGAVVSPWIGVSPANGYILVAQSDSNGVYSTGNFWLTALTASPINNSLSVAWNVSLPSFRLSSYAIAGDGTIVALGLLDSSSVINAYDGESGKLLWSLPTSQYPSSAVISGNGLLYGFQTTSNYTVKALFGMKLSTQEVVMNATIPCSFQKALVRCIGVQRAWSVVRLHRQGHLMRPA
jgi:hypothetical protein